MDQKIICFLVNKLGYKADDPIFFAPVTVFSVIPPDQLVIQVSASVIGKAGKMAKAIRTLVQATAFNKGIKRVKINIDAF